MESIFEITCVEDHNILEIVTFSDIIIFSGHAGLYIIIFNQY